jgi:cytochrome c oxidase subunit 3
MAEDAVNHHDYYLPDPSPWPIAGSISAFVALFGAVVWMKSAEGVFGLHGPWIFIVGAACVLGTMAAWFREIIVEAV